MKGSFESAAKGDTTTHKYNHPSSGDSGEEPLFLCSVISGMFVHQRAGCRKLNSLIFVKVPKLVWKSVLRDSHFSGGLQEGQNS